MQCIQLIRDLDHCEAVDENGYRCGTDDCVQSIEALSSGWDECVPLLGLTQDILAQFEAVCGECSPMPIFETCGLGVNFPESTSPCNAPHCAETMVAWYEAELETCEPEIRTMGAADGDLANLQLFYARCSTTLG